MHQRTVVQKSKGHKHDSITRVVSPSDTIAERIKPFVFFDYFDAEVTPHFQIGMHPHSGIATVTFTIMGDSSYTDTEGKKGVLNAGGIEWMKAGGGAWHQGGAAKAGRLQGIQLWIALSPSLENSASESIYVSPDDVLTKGNVRVLLGEFDGTKSAVTTPTPINYFQVNLKDGEQWRFQPPAGQTVAWVYPYEGKLRADVLIDTKELAVFNDAEDAIEVTAVDDTTFVVGTAVKHPHALVLGNYSVHTSREALSTGEKRIIEIRRQLQREGRL